MPRRPVRFSLAWLGGLALGLILILLGLYHLGDWSSGRPRVGVIEIHETIDRAERVREELEKFLEDESVKAIILRIDSPGGLVAPAQEIYGQVMKARARKKIVASLSSVAASGGYYVAAAAHRIVANPGTLTGSIGVIMPLGNLQELLRKIGVEITPITSGKLKEAGTPTRPMTEAERTWLQKVVDDLHDQFVEAVAQGRGLLKEEVLPVADGRVLSGRQALELKLVDRLGGFAEAVEEAQKLAGLEGKPELVWLSRRGRSLWEWLRSGQGQGFLAELLTGPILNRAGYFYQP